MEQQHQNILYVNRAEKDAFKGKLPTDTAEFWIGVLKHMNMLNEKPFQKLAFYALSCLSMPVSNAVVEHVFSQVTLVNTNLRNQMGQELLEAIVKI